MGSKFFPFTADYFEKSGKTVLTELSPHEMYLFLLTVLLVFTEKKAFDILNFHMWKCVCEVGKGL